VLVDSPDTEQARGWVARVLADERADAP